MTRALLMILAEADPRHEEELNAWYDDEHMVERLAIPGFLSARRWISTSTPHRYLATYEIDSLAVFASPSYLARYGDNQTPWSKRNLARLERFDRWTCELAPSPNIDPVEGGALFFSAFDPLPGEDTAVLDWYDREHLPALAGVPGVLTGRRFVAASGAPKHVGLYDLVDPSPPTHADWIATARTPWAERVIPKVAAGRLRDTFRAYPKSWRASPR